MVSEDRKLFWDVVNKFNSLILKTLDEMMDGKPERQDFLETIVSSRAGFLEPTIYRGIAYPESPKKVVEL